MRSKHEKVIVYNYYLALADEASSEYCGQKKLAILERDDPYEGAKKSSHSVNLPCLFYVAVAWHYNLYLS